MRYLRVELIPWYEDGGIVEFRIKVEADGQTYESRETLHGDDFHSMFEMLMDRAKELIKTRVEQEAKP